MRIVIIGGVAAGMSAAAKARRMDKQAEIAVYEMTEEVSFGACGLPYFVGNFFEDPNNMIARTKEQFEQSGIQMFTKHQVVSVDTEKKTIQVRNMITNELFEDHYDKMMVATGARAVIPPFRNRDLGNIFTLKSMADGVALKEAAFKEENKQVVVIGAGFIGLEVVEAMKALGKEVHLIQLDARVLPDAFDEEITKWMEEELVSHGVHVHLSESVQGFVGEGKVQAVETDKGSYPADIVVVATGVRPNTEFLKETGAEMLGNGALIINSRGETSLPDIYAAGDCASVYHLIKQSPVYIPLATTANKIGRIVGENLAGQANEFKGTLGSACVKVMDLEAGRTGLSEREAQQMNIPYKTVTIQDKNQTNYYPGQVDIHVKLIYHADTKVILGGQIIGKQGAVLRVDVLAAAIHSGMTTEELGMLDLCYAPPFARTWDVLNTAGNVAK
ncbi:CoA-disulfide reductase [Paenibacillus sp. N1-5-1-14]|uniref:CoA-disulfide reductase n=1 Tax=Paenibacillus radicibacter TaxID=2972488 RepID=UPI002158C41E|nr:CoA-disulfide reductase [Paenibacillus radicibacter]MCR8644865.1 CoA-disulfide reductase [Paenibacillus radicibacter]